VQPVDKVVCALAAHKSPGVICRLCVLVFIMRFLVIAAAVAQLVSAAVDIKSIRLPPKSAKVVKLVSGPTVLALFANGHVIVIHSRA
jgi:hypothetical protein